MVVEEVRCVSLVSPFVTFVPCLTVVMIDFIIAELDDFSVESPMPLRSLMFEELRLKMSLFLAVADDWLVWVLKTDRRPTTSSVVVEQSVVVVELR